MKLTPTCHLVLFPRRCLFSLVCDAWKKGGFLNTMFIEKGPEKSEVKGKYLVEPTSREKVRHFTRHNRLLRTVFSVMCKTYPNSSHLLLLLSLSKAIALCARSGKAGFYSRFKKILQCIFRCAVASL